MTTRTRQKGLATSVNKASRNFRRTVPVGLKSNGLSRNWLRLMLLSADLARDWYQGLSRAARLSTGAMAVTQSHSGEVLALMGHSVRAKLGLFQQAVDAGQTASFGASQAKWAGFWKDALRLFQTNVETLARINSRAIDSWLQLARDGH